MELKRENWCPLIKKECVGLKCAWFIKIEGYDTNTGKRVDEWNCSMAFLPMLLIENSGQQRQTGAAVESFRNEMVKANDSNIKVLGAAIAAGLPLRNDTPVININKDIKNYND
jgi:hypothetical protein